MRADFHEVLIERPRTGMRRRLKPPPFHWRQDDGEETPKGWKYAGKRTKRLSDRLGPLKRYLRRSVGRPWDEVYSELRAGISTRTQVQLHVLEHLRQMVTLPHELDAEDVTRTRKGWPVRGAYVCPRSGVLRWAGGEGAGDASGTLR